MRSESQHFLIVDVRASEMSDGFDAVDYLSFAVFLYEIGVAGCLCSLGDLGYGPIPGFFLPFVTERRSV